MHWGTIVLALFMGGATAGAMWAAKAGPGLPPPTKERLSLKEGSMRGHTGTRFFVGRGLVGGGLRGGK